MFFLPDQGRFDSKLTLDTFKRSKDAARAANCLPSSVHGIASKQEHISAGRGSLRYSLPKLLRSWQTDLDGSNMRYVGRYAENYDLEAQAPIPSKEQRACWEKISGNYLMSNQSLEETEPLPTDATPPPTPHILKTMELEPLPSSSLVPEWIYQDRQYMTLEQPAYPPLHQPSRPPVIRQPQPIRPIRFDLWYKLKVERDLPEPPDPKQVHCIAIQCISQTYSDFLRFRQWISDPAKSKHRGRQPIVEKQSQYYTTSQSQLSGSCHMDASRQPRRHGKFEGQDVGLRSDSGYSSDSHCSRSPPSQFQYPETNVSGRHVPKPTLLPARHALKVDPNPAPTQQIQGWEDHGQQYNRPPTHYGVFHCLHRVGRILRRMDYLRPKLGQDVDDVGDALCYVQSCLRRQRRLTQEQWDERYDTWDMNFSQKMRDLMGCVNSIERALNEEDEIDESHGIHLLGEEAADLANQLHVKIPRYQ